LNTAGNNGFFRELDSDRIGEVAFLTINQKEENVH